MKWFEMIDPIDPIEVMKLNSKTERQQIAIIKQNGNIIEYINNPSEAVQLAAVGGDGYVIKFINAPSLAVAKLVLTNKSFILFPSYYYEDQVKRIFKDNDLLMKKWLRYGEVMRS
jgi:hypothetical protein